MINKLAIFSFFFFRLYLAWMRHCATRRQSYHPERYVYRRFNRLSFFYRFVLTTFRRENIRADKRLRFPVFFFFPSPFLYHAVSPHIRINRRQSWPSRRRLKQTLGRSLYAPHPIHSLSVNVNTDVYIYIYIFGSYSSGCTTCQSNISTTNKIWKVPFCIYDFSPFSFAARENGKTSAHRGVTGATNNVLWEPRLSFLRWKFARRVDRLQILRFS